MLNSTPIPRLPLFLAGISECLSKYNEKDSKQVKKYILHSFQGKLVIFFFWE